MSAGRRPPPRLLVRTLRITFSTVATLLVAVFIVIYITVRGQVRTSVAASLEASQRMFAALETRRQRALIAQAGTLAESPTLKAALDTYTAEARTSDERAREQLLATIARELDKVAARIESDAIVVADTRGVTIAAAGPSADAWPRGRRVSLPAGDTFDGVISLGQGSFRIVRVPLLLGATSIGDLYLANNIDRAHVDGLAALAGTGIAVVNDGLMLVSTLSPQAARQFEAAIAASTVQEGTVQLDGEAMAFRRLNQIGTTGFYALSSIDEGARFAMRDAVRSLLYVAVGATLLALIGSVSLSHLLTEPVGRLSGSLEQMARSRDLDARLTPTGSSRELDALTETFNTLMASVAAAEAETEAAYTGAIRALAAALDARDPYTAGHSERVSVLSVAIGRILNLPADELEVLRLGALLHDIGKIGVADDVLRKPSGLTAEEYNAIKQHPVLGARILRSVPFLSRHLPIVELHHERPDGAGYPHGLRGDDIPLAARIVHVADAYDAITSARAYRGARPAGDALLELWRHSGTQFHAEIVGALAQALPGVTSESEPAVEAVNG